MLIDRPQVVEGSSIQNASVATGASFPSSPNVGELFYLTSGAVGFYSYNGGAWELAAKSGDLAAHIADDSMHLTAAQNTLLDQTTVTASDLNSIPSVTSRLTVAEGGLATHIADDSRHLTAAQNTLLDGLNLPTLTATHVNFVTGLTSNAQDQLNAITAVDAKQTTDISNLQSSQSSGQSSLQSQLDTHVADDSRHLTAAQNTLLDGITVDFTQVNKLTGLVSYLGSATLASKLSTLDNFKLSVDGSNAMAGTLNMSGNKIIGVPGPMLPSDAANKDYVDSFVQGLHWVGSVRVTTTQNLTLSNTQTIDGVALNVGDRVLVKDQTSNAQNGIWIVANGAWARANDYSTTLEINTSAAFVLEGTTQGKSTWIQLSTVTTVGNDPITFSAFSGPVINSAGPGILLGTGGMVSVVEGAGLTFNGNSLIADVRSDGGLILTTDNSATSTATNAQLALAGVGTQGTYRSVTTDSKGRVIAGTNPTTISGYGLTDAVSKNGDTIASLIVTGALSSNNSPVWTQANLTDNLQLANGSLYLKYADTISTAVNSTNSVNATNAVNSNTVGGWAPGNILIKRRGRIHSDDGTSLNSSIVAPEFGFSYGGSGEPAGPFIAFGGLDGNINYSMQLSGAYSVGNVFKVRTRNDDPAGGGIWNPWRNLLHDGNYNTYSPTLTGTGASGVWPISITGNALYATSAGSSNTATLATKASTLSQSGGTGAAMTFNYNGLGGQPTWLWGTNDGITTNVYNPSNFSVSYAANAGYATNAGNASTLTGFTIAGRVSTDWNNVTYRTTGFYSASDQPTNAPYPYASLISAANSDVGLQVAGGYNSDALYFRGWYSSGTYTAWRSVIHNGNIGSQSVNYANTANLAYTANVASNATSISSAVGNGYTWTGIQYFQCNKGNNSYGRDNNSYNMFFSNDGGGAGFSFHRGGAYATNMVLDPDNWIRMGGWSAGADRVSFDMSSGAIVAAGNITAYSDARLKTNVEVIPNALEKVNAIRGVTFNRIEDGSRGTGVIAQEVQEVLPEAVFETANGTLSVAYGNIVGLLVESIKELQQEVRELRALVEKK